jgi:hypothetical protein
MLLKSSRKFAASPVGQAVSMTEIKNPDDALQHPTPAPLRPRSAHAPTLRPPYSAPLRPSTRAAPAAAAATGALPNTVIIGAMKCGTTSLHTYLDCHPSISMSRRKETNFFVHHQNWSKGLGWYRSHFTEDKPVIGESSPNYARYPVFPGVPERMHMVVPTPSLSSACATPSSAWCRTTSTRTRSDAKTAPPKRRSDSARTIPICSAAPTTISSSSTCAISTPGRSNWWCSRTCTATRWRRFRACSAFWRRPQLRGQPLYPRLAEDARRRLAPPQPAQKLDGQKKVRGVYWTERNLPWLFGPRPSPNRS